MRQSDFLTAVCGISAFIFGVLGASQVYFATKITAYDALYIGAAVVLGMLSWLSYEERRWKWLARKNLVFARESWDPVWKWKR